MNVKNSDICTLLDLMKSTQDEQTSSTIKFNFDSSLTKLVLSEALHKFISNDGKSHKFNGTLAAILHQSVDTISKKTRGSHPFSVHDLDIICSHFQITPTLNKLSMPLLKGNSEYMFGYFKGIVEQMRNLSYAKEKRIVLTAEDIPIFYYFGYPQLLKMKLYYYQSTIYNELGLLDKNIYSDEQIDQLIPLFDLYNKIPSKELWTPRTLDGTISQFIYLVKTKKLTDKKFIQEILDNFNEMIIDIFKNAEKGIKGIDGAESSMYQSNISLSNNEIYFEADGQKSCFVNVNTFNSIKISNQPEVDEVIHWVEHMFKTGTLISIQSPEIREQLLEQLLEKLRALQQMLNS